MWVIVVCTREKMRDSNQRTADPNPEARAYSTILVNECIFSENKMLKALKKGFPAVKKSFKYIELRNEVTIISNKSF